MNWWLWMIPVISAFIGWIITLVAIKMLFHPRKPIRIPGVTIQGILPKRRAVFAEKLGKLASADLLSFDDIEQKITSPENLQKVMPMVETHIDHFLRTKLSKAFPMISMFIGDKTINQLKEVFMQELEEIFPALLKGYLANLKQELDLEKIVAAKVDSFLGSEQLEKNLYGLMGREFCFAKITGAVIGFLIGLVQVVITVAVS